MMEKYDDSKAGGKKNSEELTKDPILGSKIEKKK